jgi:hypothetical protein
MWREDDEEEVRSYCMTLRKGGILNIERGSTSSHSVENLFHRRLWVCRKPDNRMNEYPVAKCRACNFHVQTDGTYVYHCVLEGYGTLQLLVVTTVSPLTYISSILIFLVFHSICTEHHIRRNKMYRPLTTNPSSWGNSSFA